VYRWKLWTVILLLAARITSNLASLAVLEWVWWPVQGHVAVATHFGKMLSWWMLLDIRSQVYVCHFCFSIVVSSGFPLMWKVTESPGILLMVREKLYVSSELRLCCLFLLKKWKYTFNACYNKMVMDSSWCRVGGVD